MGRRTICTPERRHREAVRSLRGLTQPRRPASAINAGSTVIEAAQPTATVTDRAGPTVEKTPSLVKAKPKNVIATVPADPAITFPIDPRAATTASSELRPP